MIEVREGRASALAGRDPFGEMVAGAARDARLGCPCNRPSRVHILTCRLEGHNPPLCILRLKRGTESVRARIVGAAYRGCRSSQSLGRVDTRRELSCCLFRNNPVLQLLAARGRWRGYGGGGRVERSRESNPHNKSNSMSTVLDEPQTQPSTSPSQRLRSAMAAARVSVHWFGVLEGCQPSVPRSGRPADQPRPAE